MKKLLMGSIALTLFSFSIMLFQYSCKKEAIAQTQSSTENLDISLLAKDIQMQSGTTTDSAGNTSPVLRYAKEYYIINNDGTNFTKINITMAPGTVPSGSARLSPDGSKIVFEAFSDQNVPSIYSVRTDGTNLTKIIEGIPLAIQGTY